MFYPEGSDTITNKHLSMWSRDIIFHPSICTLALLIQWFIDIIHPFPLPSTIHIVTPPPSSVLSLLQKDSQNMEEKELRKVEGNSERQLKNEKKDCQEEEVEEIETVEEWKKESQEWEEENER